MKELKQPSTDFGVAEEMLNNTVIINENRPKAEHHTQHREIIMLPSSNARDLVTAACPYPALRLDKLYAALIRCLGLWTVTKQFLVFFGFKGPYLLAGGSDVTRGISCDPSLHLFGSDVIPNTLPSLYLHALRLSNFESSYLVALTLTKSCED